MLSAHPRLRAPEREQAGNELEDFLTGPNHKPFLFFTRIEKSETECVAQTIFWRRVQSVFVR
jgi:hypothetical protein